MSSAAELKDELIPLSSRRAATTIVTRALARRQHARSVIDGTHVLLSFERRRCDVQTRDNRE